MSTPGQSQLSPWYPRCRSLAQCTLAVTFSKKALSKIAPALPFLLPLNSPPNLFPALLPYSSQPSSCLPVTSLFKYEPSLKYWVIFSVSFVCLPSFFLPFSFLPSFLSPSWLSCFLPFFLSLLEIRLLLKLVSTKSTVCLCIPWYFTEKRRV